ncbi:MAG: CBS domain-containing protein [Candidatus Eiseniibacteriota bacterium]|jgi:CBS domain-containing protein
MKTVKELLDAKGHDVATTTPDTSVFEALKVMADRNVGALIVLEGEQIVGIFSERDYARKVILKGKSSREIMVREIMTPEVVYTRFDQTIDQCMAMMTARHCRHLPVVDDSRLAGIISIGDVVKEVISEQQWTIEMLEDYITGKR